MSHGIALPWLACLSASATVVSAGQPAAVRLDVAPARVTLCLPLCGARARHVAAAAPRVGVVVLRAAQHLSRAGLALPLPRRAPDADARRAERHRHPTAYIDQKHMPLLLNMNIIRIRIVIVLYQLEVEKSRRETRLTGG